MANNVWHVGFAVPDLEAAKDEFGKLYGLTWRPNVLRSLRLTLADGSEIEVDVNVTFSEGGPFAVELWQSVDGTPLETPKSGWFHHVGYWVDDWEHEARRLEELGYASVLRNGENPLINLGPGGMFIEPCNLHRDQPYLRDLYPIGSPFAGEPVLPQR